MQNDPTVEWAKRIQALLGMNDPKFAEELGITESYWSLLKSGKRSGRGYKFLVAVQKLAERFRLPSDLHTDSEPKQLTPA
jgi:transcriptional regulator with XRE-family HTH domain